MNVDESSSLDPLALEPILDDGHGTTHLLAALDEELAELAHGCPIVDRTVVTAELSRGLVTFDPAARLEGAVGLAVQCIPVFDASKQPTDVDKVKGVFRECPTLRAVVYLA